MANLRPPRRGGVAVGISTIICLGFISMVFMFSRPLQIIDHTSNPAHGYVLRVSEPIIKGEQIASELMQNKTETPVNVKNATVETPTPVTKTTNDTTNALADKGNSTTQPSQAPKSSETTKENTEKLSELDIKYKPTKEMVMKVQQNGYLVVTWANHHYYDFVRTWISHVREVNVTGFLVGAMDDELLQRLITQVPNNCFSMRSGLTLGDFGWGSPTFAKMGREKIRLIRTFLNLGVNVVIADVDVLFLRNPLPYFDRYPTADILTSSDHLKATVNGEELENPAVAWSAANIGIMLFRNKSMDLVDTWIKIIESDDKIWDQNAFNDLFRRRFVLPAEGSEMAKQHLFYGYEGNLVMGILPVSLFCSGHTLYTQHLARRMGLQPYAVHATFQFSGTPGKRHRMREEGWWDDPPEYYRPNGGIVSFEMDGLSNLLRPSQRPIPDPTHRITIDPRFRNLIAQSSEAVVKNEDLVRRLQNVEGHFQLVNHQLLRLRAGLALATSLGRVLVVPQLACFADRWWAPHEGVIPGSDMVTPFTCPLDHVLDLESGIFGKWDAAALGPMIDIREHSFLANPRLPVETLNDMVLVEVCPRDISKEELNKLGCNDGSQPAKVLESNPVGEEEREAGAAANDVGDGDGGEEGREEVKEVKEEGAKREKGEEAKTEGRGADAKEVKAKEIKALEVEAMEVKAKETNDKDIKEQKKEQESGKKGAEKFKDNSETAKGEGQVAATTTSRRQRRGTRRLMSDGGGGGAAAAAADLPSNNAALTTSDAAIVAVNSTVAVDNVVANTPTNIVNTTATNSTTKTAANETNRPTSAVADLGSNAQNLEAIAAASQEDSQSQEVLNSIAQPIATSAFRGVVRIAPDLDSAKLLIALSSVRTAKVLHFRTLVGAVKDFGLGLTHSPDAKEKFMRRLQVYGSIWCCVASHPGHVHYDLLWDVPHTDKFNRVWSENNTWVQLPGP